MPVNDYSLQSKIPSGRNVGLRGLNLVALAALSPFWLPLAIDGYDWLKHEVGQSESYVSAERASSPTKVRLIPDLQLESEFVSKSEMRIYVKAEGVLPMNGLCWFDIVDGHGRKKGGERAECDRP